MPTRGALPPAALPLLPFLFTLAAVPLLPAAPAAAAGPAISPADGSTVTSRTVTIQVRAPAGGGRLLVDGVERDSGRSRDLTYTMDGRAVPNGTHRVRFDAALAWDDDSSATFKLAVRPAAPTGVAASVSGRTVTVTWNANGEPDITGYTVQSEQGGASTGPCSGTCRASFEVPASATGALAVGVEAERAGATFASPTSYNFVDLGDPAPAPQPQDPAPQPEPVPGTPSPGPAPQQPAPVPSASPKPGPSGSGNGAPTAPDAPGAPPSASPSSAAQPSAAPSLPNWLGPSPDPGVQPGQTPGLSLLPSLPAVAPSPQVAVSEPLGLLSSRDPLFPVMDEHAAQGTAVAGVLFLSLTHLGLWARRRRLAALVVPPPPTAHERVAAGRAAIETAVRSNGEATSGTARRNRG